MSSGIEGRTVIVIGDNSLSQASDDYLRPKLAQIPLGRFGAAREVSNLTVPGVR